MIFIVKEEKVVNLTNILNEITLGQSKPFNLNGPYNSKINGKKVIQYTFELPEDEDNEEIDMVVDFIEMVPGEVYEVAFRENDPQKAQISGGVEAMYGEETGRELVFKTLRTVMEAMKEFKLKNKNVGAFIWSGADKGGRRKNFYTNLIKNTISTGYVPGIDTFDEDPIKVGGRYKYVLRDKDYVMKNLNEQDKDTGDTEVDVKGPLNPQDQVSVTKGLSKPSWVSSIIKENSWLRMRIVKEAKKFFEENGSLAGSEKNFGTMINFLNHILTKDEKQWFMGAAAVAKKRQEDFMAGR